MQDMIDALISGSLKPEDVTPIRIFEIDGKLWSLDNRRLYAFQQANKPIPYVMASPQEVAKEAPSKMTTKNDGRSIRLRGAGRALGVLGFAMGTLELAQAAGPCGEPGRALGGLIGGAAGGILGATAGRAVGAALGSAVMPGIGTIVGGAIGGLAGGAIGDWLGSKLDKPRDDCNCP